jgi:4-hydroxy-tetrahydrodipicolinate reductase
MKIGVIGYGKMGKEIEKIAIERGHSTPLIFDVIIWMT